MKRLNTKQFNDLLNNPNAGFNICNFENNVFFTINFYATELNTGIGINDAKIFKQTWELIDTVSDSFRFMMWGQEPAQHNQFINTLHHEGKNMLIGIEDIIKTLKGLCLPDLNNSDTANFELKTLRICQGVSTFFNTLEEYSIEYINDINKYNGKRVLIELFFPKSFQFPLKTIKNDFCREMNVGFNSHETNVFYKKSFVGNLFISPVEIKIDNNSNEFPEDYEFEKDFTLSITQCSCCLQMKFFDKKLKQSFELPIESFNLVPTMV
jgi:hypothetical protein